MDKDGITAGISAILALISIALAVFYFEGVMAVTALFSLVYGVIAYKRCDPTTCRILTVTTLMIIVLTIISATVLTPDNFLNQYGNPTKTWLVIIGLVHSIPIVPLTLCTFTIIASFGDSSFNWAIIRGLSPFIGIGIEVPGFVLEYIFIGSDEWMVDNGYILYHFLMTLIVVAISAYIVTRKMRRESVIITADGRRNLNADQ